LVDVVQSTATTADEGRWILAAEAREERESNSSSRVLQSALWRRLKLEYAKKRLEIGE
jgi:hypothetical protein